jgi:hypothetical protein
MRDDSFARAPARAEIARRLQLLRGGISTFVEQEFA